MSDPWVQFRKVRARFRGTLLAFPFVVVIIGLCNAGFGFAWAAPVFGLPLLVLFMLNGFRYMHWPCPRCRKPFFRSLFFTYNNFAKSCGNCELPLFG